jgi:hypothetical protein
MKKFIALPVALLLFMTIDGYGQPEMKTYRKLPDVTKYVLLNETSGENAFYISVNPVTNREYITYLCWLSIVYRSYPEVFYKALPGIGSAVSEKQTDNTKTNDEILLSIISSDELNREYIFNPKYADYPVTGITWNQAMNFLGWMSDRYNEISLIRNMELNYDPNQCDYSNFNTEAYLSDQYEGVVNRLRIDKITKQERRSDWSDKVYYPAFRLPSSAELKLSEKSLKKEFIPYMPDKFLGYWMNQYTDIKKDTLYLGKGDGWEASIKIVAPGKKPTAFPLKADELAFDAGLDSKHSGILKIYGEIGQTIIDQKSSGDYLEIQKDDLGHMGYIIAGEDNNSKPVYVKRIVYARQIPTNKFTIIRFAMSAVR